MKRSRFSEEQIAYALQQAESVIPVVDVCRQIGMSEATTTRRKKRCGDLGVSELRRLKMDFTRFNRHLLRSKLNWRVSHEGSQIPGRI